MTEPKWLTQEEIDNIQMIGIEKQPIYVDTKGNFYFTDEAWCDLNGPYETYKDCNAALSAYAKTI
jgi:uncharacterized protein YqkB